MDHSNVSPAKNNLGTNGPCAIYEKPFKIGGSLFLLDKRYGILEVLGTGAYGVVVSARDTQSGQMVAIKKIEKAFEHPTYTKRTLRELKILRLLSNENILHLNTIQLPKSKAELDVIYLKVN